jgi:hypothetical protein
MKICREFKLREMNKVGEKPYYFISRGQDTCAVHYFKDI